MRSKYIAGTVNTGFLPVEVAIVFPEVLDHASVAKRLGMEEISSAGFVMLDFDGQWVIQLYGNSVSLKVESNTKDTRLVAEALGLQSMNGNRSTNTFTTKGTNMQHTYRYLQQAFIPRVKEWTEGKGILGNLNMSYMGSAEFEFGAVPKALGRFLNAVEPLVFGKITVTLPNHPLYPDKGTSEVLVRYLVRESQQVMLEEMLRNWTRAAKSFKEWNVHLNRPNDLVFCIDKGYEAFMWRGKLGKRLIASQVQASVDLLVKHGWMEASPLNAQQRINELCGVHQDQE